jgi:hypothetical protein
MPDLNDPGMQWFPRKCAINHALEIIRGMRRECGTALTMTRHRARHHSRRWKRAAQHHAMMPNVSEELSRR